MNFRKKLKQESKNLAILEAKYAEQIKIIEKQNKNQELNASQAAKVQEKIDQQRQELEAKQLEVDLLQGRKESDYTALYFTLGQLYIQLEKHKEAIGQLNIAIKNFPNFYRAYKIMLVAFLQSNDFDKAYKTILKVLELKGGDGDIYGFLGFLHLQKEQYFSAAKAYEMALLYFPDNKSFKRGLLQASMIQENHQQNIALANELMLKAPRKEKIQYLLIQANAYLSQEQYDKALEILKLAEILGSDQAKSLLAKLYLQKGLILESLNNFEYLIKVKKNPTFADIETMLSYLFDLNEFKKAKDFIKLLKKHYKNLPKQELMKLQGFEAQVLFDQGKTKQAIKTLKKILDQDPLNASALLTLIQYHADKKSFLQANLYCERLYQNEAKAFEAFVKMC